MTCGFAGHALTRHESGWGCSCGLVLGSSRREARDVLRYHQADVRMEPVTRALATPPTDDCVLWTGYVDPALGYGKFAGGYAHRLIYELTFGLIAPAMQVDHLCRNRACVNPQHLEQVTQAENIRRGYVSRDGYDPDERCRRGHPRTPENTYWHVKTGKRDCQPCRRENEAKSRARRAA